MLDYFITKDWKIEFYTNTEEFVDFRDRALEILKQ